MLRCLTAISGQSITEFELQSLSSSPHHLCLRSIYERSPCTSCDYRDPVSYTNTPIAPGCLIFLALLWSVATGSESFPNTVFTLPLLIRPSQVSSFTALCFNPNTYRSWSNNASKGFKTFPCEGLMKCWATVLPLVFNELICASDMKIPLRLAPPRYPRLSSTPRNSIIMKSRSCTFMTIFFPSFFNHVVRNVTPLPPQGPSVQVVRPPGAPLLKDYDSFTDGSRAGSFDFLSSASGDLFCPINTADTEMIGEPSNSSLTVDDVTHLNDGDTSMSIEEWRANVSFDAPSDEINSSLPLSSTTKRPRSPTPDVVRRIRPRARSISSASSTTNDFDWFAPLPEGNERPPSRASSAPG